MEDFTNLVILPDNLPKIEKQLFNKLEKKYLRILLLQLFLFFITLTAAFVTFIILNKQVPARVIVLISAGISALFIYSALITVLGFPRKGYLLRENDISFKRGLITYKQTSVPFNRIQHVEINQGVLEKIYRLSSVKIYTAGGNASDLSIPGLKEDIAQNLKTFLSEKISEHE